ncbi:hypothetical protein ACFCWG_18510 [Streptomyces sp. NPDC056390]|uniref:hypothetical protein n=1 Tax=Streptomyces sp. NPDC056390 TaxID=3345806 RepID=UPI0035DB1028
MLQRRAAAQTHAVDEQGFYLETVSEYLWARDVAGLAPTTLEKLVQPVMELCSFYDLVPWRLEPRHVDRFYAGQNSSSPRLFRAPSRRSACEIGLRPSGVRGELPVGDFVASVGILLA